MRSFGYAGRALSAVFCIRIASREHITQGIHRIDTKAAATHTPTGDDLKIVGLNYVLLNDYADAVKWFEKL